MIQPFKGISKDLLKAGNSLGSGIIVSVKQEKKGDLYHHTGLYETINEKTKEEKQ